MNDENEMITGDGKTLIPQEELVQALLGQALLLFDDYHLVNRNQDKFITLNEDFVVELFTAYHVIFWSGNTIILAINGTSSTVRPKLDFEGTKEEFYVLANVLNKLLEEIGEKYSKESSALQKKSVEVIAALAQKYGSLDL